MPYIKQKINNTKNIKLRIIVILNQIIKNIFTLLISIRKEKKALAYSSPMGPDLRTWCILSPQRGP